MEKFPGTPIPAKYMDFESLTPKWGSVMYAVLGR